MAEFSLRADVTPGVQQHAGQHVGERGKNFATGKIMPP